MRNKKCSQAALLIKFISPKCVIPECENLITKSNCFFKIRFKKFHGQHRALKLVSVYWVIKVCKVLKEAPTWKPQWKSAHWYPCCPPTIYIQCWSNPVGWPIPQFTHSTSSPNNIEQQISLWILNYMRTKMCILKGL